MCTATGNIPQPSYVSVDNVSACSDISYRALFTYILQHMPHSLELIQLCGFFFHEQSPAWSMEAAFIGLFSIQFNLVNFDNMEGKK